MRLGAEDYGDSFLNTLEIILSKVIGGGMRGRWAALPADPCSGWDLCR